MIVTVLGEKYQSVERAVAPATKKLTELLIPVLGVFAFLPQHFDTGPRKREKVLRVDIVSEYELILQKKSKLSRSERDLVVRQFNKTFKKVVNPDSNLQTN